MHTRAFDVTFWGVRGSVPCPGSDYTVYGGNTSCVEVTCGNQTIIFDAGTGLRLLGKKLQRQKTQHISMLLSHTHFDHISGLPFFAPAYDRTVRLDMYAAHLDTPLQQVLDTVMQAPFFPISPATFNADVRCHDKTPGETYQLGDVTVRTAALNHPDNATGYRLEYNNKSLCYVTDTEHTETLDSSILALIESSDMVIYDSTFTDEDYARHKGWGHSSWQEGMRLCQKADAKKLMLFHHNPDYDDEALHAIEHEAQAAWPGHVNAAREGVTFSL